MKRKTLLIFIIYISLFSISFAHPGRTDSNGGHYDRSTGEYHYHDGSKVQNSIIEDNKKTNKYKERQKSDNKQSIIENNTKIIDNKNDKYSTNDDNSFMILLIVIIGIVILWKTNPFKKK